ncbi:MAG: hypothetical protein FE041_05190 [Thermoplasmata archaeon]|nr:MAG: hypothetical protein FE041_05190 [Thermoplasmata archaeon]
MHEWHGGKGKGFTRVVLGKGLNNNSWRQRIYQTRKNGNNSSTPLGKDNITTTSARKRRRREEEKSILHGRSYSMKKCYVSYSFHGFSCSCQRKHHAACLLLLLLFIMQIFGAMNTSFQLHSCSTASCCASIY